MVGSLNATAPDRRRHPRHPGGSCHLMVSGRPARLVDWSFGGIGVRLDSGVDGFGLDDAVEVRIHRRATDAWETLCGRVCRIDRTERRLGMALDDDGSGSVRVLVELLSDRLDELAIR